MNHDSNRVFIAEWSAPSNIAIIKYWGKYGDQLPRNPSISFTLNHAKTTTRVQLIPSTSIQGPKVDFLLDNVVNAKFAQRIQSYIDRHLDSHYAWLKGYNVLIHSSNTFPHSSGIASSASAMAALALCLTDLEEQFKATNNPSIDVSLASNRARLASGSACRSLYPYMSVWGQHKDFSGSSDIYGIGVEEYMHPVFRDFHDDILIVSPSEKSVSSTAGHALMDTNPYAATRYNVANEGMTAIKNYLIEGNIDGFGLLAESEALMLHALMMCSHPSFILMKPSTLTIIEKIKTYRLDTGHHIYFTLDAGPNVHVLYPDSDAHLVRSFIEEELVPLCFQNKILNDCVGQGPQKLL